MILVNPIGSTHKEIPNLALAYIGTISNSKIIDLNTLREPVNRFLDHRVDVLGISVQSRNYSQYEIIKELYKKKYSDSKIVSVSGVIDVECCYSFLKMKENMNFSQLFNDSLPFPDYALFDSFGIFERNWRSGKWPYTILTSQGCQFECIYCVARDRPLQLRSVENCCQELEEAKEKYGIKSFQVLDDCFNSQPERVIDFCEKVKYLNLTWYCGNGLRVDRFNEELAKTLARSGCKGVSFGIESTDSNVLKSIKKGITFRSIDGAIKIAKKYFNFINGFFIIGLPGSSYSKDLASLHWALQSGITAHFSYYLPFNESMNFDESFYGEFSRPISNEYPKDLQKRIFDLTEFMRVERPNWELRKSLGINFKKILRYDIFYLPLYLKIMFKKNV